MKKYNPVIATLLLLPTSLCFANGILSDMDPHTSYIELSAKEMDSARGAAMIYGQAYPSTTSGLVTHMVTYKGWGNLYDYTSYNYIGSSYSGGTYYFSENGVDVYRVGGDSWKADTKSAPTTWVNANSQQIEYHYQILNPSTGSPTPYAFRALAWNRPINKFFW